MIPFTIRWPDRYAGALLLMAPFLLAASCPRPRIERFDVQPGLVCPGDAVRVELIAASYSQGVIERDSAGTGTAPWTLLSRSDDLSATGGVTRVCDDTLFLARVWKGDGPDCSSEWAACASAFVSVLDGEQFFEYRASACSGTFPGRVELDFEIIDATTGEGGGSGIGGSYSSSLRVGVVTSCSRRTLRLQRQGGDVVVLDPGAASSAFAGTSLGGSWTMSQDLVPGEGCPGPFGPVDPGPHQPTPPPELCVNIGLSCPGPDADCP